MEMDVLIQTTPQPSHTTQPLEKERIIVEHNGNIDPLILEETESAIRCEKNEQGVGYR